MTAPSRRSGFTIIEVVLAMGVLMLAMSMILGLLTFGAALSRTAALRGQSAATVEAVVHDLEESLFPLEDDGGVGPPREIVDRPVPGAPGVVYSATAEPNPDTAVQDAQGETSYREYLVEVNVRWQAGGVRRAQTWRTLMLREVPFGERMRRRYVASE